MPDIQEMEPFSTLWLNVTPETWSRGGELQGAGRRCKDVTSSLASCWDLLSVCLQADWADWPHFGIWRKMGVGTACHIRASVWRHRLTCRTYTFVAHHLPKFAKIGALIGCRSAADTTLQVKFIFKKKTENQQCFFLSPDQSWPFEIVLLLYYIIDLWHSTVELFCITCRLQIQYRPLPKSSLSSMLNTQLLQRYIFPLIDGK